MLHEEPKKDGFAHETPIRAFTTWTTEGVYALGKGFRPSLQHLVPYLDAMERKEGWRLVQVLEAGTQTPSFLFRQERPQIYQITVGGMDPDPAVLKSVSFMLDGAVSVSQFHDGFVDTNLADPVMPEVRTYLDQRDPGDEDPSCDDIDGLAPDHVTVPGRRIFDQTPERIIRAPQALGAPYQAPKDWTDIQNGDLYEKVARAIHDDPVNPKHYNGTHCAEIAENLPGNLAHAITYVWRAGDKPDQPELVELDKALWWMNRELYLAKAHAEVEDENFLLDGQMDHMNWHIEGSGANVYQANPRKHNFYDYTNGRIGVAELVGWKASAVRGMVLYAIGRKVAPLRNAIACVEQRRGSLARVRPLAEGEGSTVNLEMGRKAEP